MASQRRYHDKEGPHKDCRRSESGNWPEIIRRRNARILTLTKPAIEHQRKLEMVLFRLKIGREPNFYRISCGALQELGKMVDLPRIRGECSCSALLTIWDPSEASKHPGSLAQLSSALLQLWNPCEYKKFPCKNALFWWIHPVLAIWKLARNRLTILKIHQNEAKKHVQRSLKEPGCLFQLPRRVQGVWETTGEILDSYWSRAQF